MTELGNCVALSSDGGGRVVLWVDRLLVSRPAQDALRADPSDITTTAVLVVGGLALRRAAPVACACIVAIGVDATSGRLTGIDVVAFAIASFSMADSRTRNCHGGAR